MSNVIKMIKREMADRHMSQTELSRKLNMHQTSVLAMLNGKTLKVHRLFQLCKIFNYNFFGEIAGQLSVNNPVLELSLKLKEEEMTDKIDELNNEINRLSEENKTLKVKFDLLESVIEKLGGT